MTELQERAIARLDEQAEKSSDANIKQIAQVLIEAAGKSDAGAERFLEEGLTIAGAFGKVREKARGSGNSGAVSDEDAYEIMFGYYGIKGLRVRTRLVVEGAPAESEKKRGGIVSLADFL